MTLFGDIPGNQDLATANHVLPAGLLAPFAGSAAPAGWLPCDGAAVSRTTYSALFAALGTAYGVGDGSTTFNLPDLRGRVPVGEDGAAGRLTANDARGQSGGTERHALAAGELPAHTHPVGGQGHVYTGSAAWTLSTISLGSGSLRGGLLDNSNAFADTTATGSTGGGTAHNNMPPYQAVGGWIVKT